MGLIQLHDFLVSFSSRLQWAGRRLLRPLAAFVGWPHHAILPIHPLLPPTGGALCLDSPAHSADPRHRLGCHGKGLCGGGAGPRCAHRSHGGARRQGLYRCPLQQAQGGARAGCQCQPAAGAAQQQRRHSAAAPSCRGLQGAARGSRAGPGGRGTCPSAHPTGDHAHGPHLRLAPAPPGRQQRTLMCAQPEQAWRD